MPCAGHALRDKPASDCVVRNDAGDIHLLPEVFVDDHDWEPLLRNGMHRRVERLRVNGKHYRPRGAGIRKRRDLGEQRPHVAASVLELKLRSDLLRLAPRTARRLDRGVPHQVAGDKAPAASYALFAPNEHADACAALDEPSLAIATSVPSESPGFKEATLSRRRFAIRALGATHFCFLSAFTRTRVS